MARGDIPKDISDDGRASIAVALYVLVLDNR